MKKEIKWGRNLVNQKFIKFLFAFIISEIAACCGFIPSQEYLLLSTFICSEGRKLAVQSMTWGGG